MPVGGESRGRGRGRGGKGAGRGRGRGRPSKKADEKSPELEDVALAAPKSKPNPQKKPGLGVPRMVLKGQVILMGRLLLPNLSYHLVNFLVPKSIS